MSDGNDTQDSGAMDCEKAIYTIFESFCNIKPGQTYIANFPNGSKNYPQPHVRFGVMKIANMHAALKMNIVEKFNPVLYPDDHGEKCAPPVMDTSGKPTRRPTLEFECGKNEFMYRGTIEDFTKAVNSNANVLRTSIEQAYRDTPSDMIYRS